MDNLLDTSDWGTGDRMVLLSHDWKRPPDGMNTLGSALQVSVAEEDTVTTCNRGLGTMERHHVCVNPFLQSLCPLPAH